MKFQIMRKLGERAQQLKGSSTLYTAKEMQPECSTPYPKAVLVHYLRLKEEGAK